MKNKGISLDKLIIVIGIIIIILMSYELFFKDMFKNKYQKIEDKMISSAKDYIENNHINTNKEIYLDVSKLNIKLENNCSITSGVIYDGNSYKAYLSCDEYKSIVTERNDSEKDFITLKGEEVIVLNKGMNYYEPGYISNDSITITGDIGTEEGIYNLFYKTKNGNHFVTRKIIIVNDEKIINLFPVITLKGEEKYYMVIGTTYQEPGYEAKDLIDGNINDKVKVENNVNYHYPGEYIISYTVTNSKGYTNGVTRKVFVISQESDLVVNHSLTPSNLTNGNVTITLNMNGEYDYIINPLGEKNNSLNYIVSENGNYVFHIYDKYGREVVKNVTVNNIKREIPTGTCKAVSYYNRTEIEVSITSSTSISSYEYVIDNNHTTMQTNKYQSNITNPTNIKIIVKDIINNVGEIICSLKKDITRKIVTNSNGKNCLEGLVCYIQFDYSHSNYPFCATSSSCSNIGRGGCSLTSVTNALAMLGGKSKSGALYNPFTIYEEVYPIHANGTCNGGCSAWARMMDAIKNAGFITSSDVLKLNNSTTSIIIEHLKKGYPVIVHASGAPFSEGSGHYMTLIGIREDNYVFLSDSANKSSTEKSYYKGKQYYVDTWIPLSDLISGHIDEFILVGPKGGF